MSKRWHQVRKRRVLAVLLVVFILLNVCTTLAYRNQTYPNTSISGRSIGSVRHSVLSEQIRTVSSLPVEIELLYSGKTTKVSTLDIGIQIDYQQTAEQIIAERSRLNYSLSSWLPISNFLTQHDAVLFLAVNPTTYRAKIADISEQYKKSSIDARLELRNGNFVTTPEVNAIAIDASGTQARIVKVLSEAKGAPNRSALVDVMTKKTPPAVTLASLEQTLRALQIQRSTAITLQYQAKTKKFKPAEIGSWFKAVEPVDVAFSRSDGQSFSLSDAKIDSAIADAGLELGSNATNANELTAQVKQSISENKAVTLSLIGNPLGTKTYSYCIAGRGVPESEIGTLTSKAASTLNAQRGWSLSGNVTFTKDASGINCEFTLWLASADQMSSFGIICEPLWSCAVRPNVVINYDRWRNASEAWNKDGGSLDDYRAMVVNHEVGHWLGFEHSNCPSSGLAAPVMQQQSIDLQGCTFNPWPSTTERISLRNYIGL